MVIDLISFGAVADGISDSTAITQKAIDLCFENGGGEIVFSSGSFVISTLFLKSGVSVRINKGVFVLGALDFLSYRKDETVNYELYQDASHSFFNCSMFVGIDIENVKIYGGGVIDMRSVWDVNNIRNMHNRGAKCIALKNCKNIVLSDFELYNATDLAIYFAGCRDIEVGFLKLRTHIDGISPDNSQNVYIHDCFVESGDDGIVFKSSFSLNKLGVCENITVNNCIVQSCCNAIKFGTETNGGFKNISIKNCKINFTPLAGIAVESVDGAIIDGITFENIVMKNVGSPFFVYVGKRMRGPKYLTVGKISNIIFKNISASGEYGPFDIIACNYETFTKKKKTVSHFGMDKSSAWQVSSGVYGLQDSIIENISFVNVDLKLYGGYDFVPEGFVEPARVYPEVYVYGRTLPAKAICFRYVKGLTIKNVSVSTYFNDVRDDFYFDNVCDVVTE